MDMQGVLTGAQEALTVRRVFGEPYEREGVTVIPVAKVAGGGGGGQGAAPGGEGEGSGGGFGLRAEPAGVYIVRGEEVSWEPAIDVNRLILGAQVVVVAVLIVVRAVVKRRRKRG